LESPVKTQQPVRVFNNPTKHTPRIRHNLTKVETKSEKCRFLFIFLGSIHAITRESHPNRGASLKSARSLTKIKLDSLYFRRDICLSRYFKAERAHQQKDTTSNAQNEIEGREKHNAHRKTIRKRERKEESL